VYKKHDIITISRLK